MNHLRSSSVGIAGVMLLACTKDVDTIATAAQLDSPSFQAVGPSATPCSPATIPAPNFEIHGATINAQQRNFLVANGYCTFFIPEYHDEQRLSNGSSGYGSIAYSYAFPPTASYLNHDAFDRGYRQVANVYVGGNDLPAPYNALKLQAGPNCVYLAHLHSGVAAQWKARITPPGTNGLCEGGTGGDVVAASEQPSPNADDYPAVTRWVEGPGRVPLLGVRCGNEWCLIGPGSPAASAHTGKPGAENTSRWTIRGWHDDQTLGVLPGGAGPIAPTGPKLSVVPKDDLGSKDVGAYLNTWVDVATVLVPAGTNLTQKYGPPGYRFVEGINTLAIRHIDSSGVDRWEGRVTNSMGARIYSRPVLWQDHSSWGITSVPGTARWRWRENDEEIWVRCGIGCCMVQPDE